MWRTPQASQFNSGHLYAIAMRASLEDRMAALWDDEDREAMLLRTIGEARQYDDRLGLSPKGMLQLRWSVRANGVPGRPRLIRSARHHYFTKGSDKRQAAESHMTSSPREGPAQVPRGAAPLGTQAAQAHPTAASRDLIDKRKEAGRAGKAAVEAADGWRPKIVNLNFRPNGPLAAQPKIQWVTGHYTAGPVDRNDTECEAAARDRQLPKLSNGWTMIGCRFAISRKGTLYLCRPATMVGAHVNHNTANVGVVCNGTTGDRPTAAQAKTFRWLLQNAHTAPCHRPSG